MTYKMLNIMSCQNLPIKVMNLSKI